MPVVQYITAIPREFVRQDVLSATVRVYVGRHAVRRQDLWDVLSVLQADIIENVYRMEKPYEWFVTFVNAEVAEQFCQANEEVAYGGGSLHLSMLNKQVVSVRVHWVPDYFDQDFLERIVGQWGRIRSVEVYHNMFRFELEVTLQGAHEVPHVLVLPDGKRFLVTMPGRLSMCLKCNELGHIRSSCGRVLGQVPVPMATAQIETQTDVSCFDCVEQESQVDLPAVLVVSQETQVKLPAMLGVSQETQVNFPTMPATVKQGAVATSAAVPLPQRKKEDRERERTGTGKRRSEEDREKVVKSGRVTEPKSPSSKFLDDKYMDMEDDRHERRDFSLDPRK